MPRAMVDAAATKMRRNKKLEGNGHLLQRASYLKGLKSEELATMDTLLTRMKETVDDTMKKIYYTLDHQFTVSFEEVTKTLLEDNEYAYKLNINDNKHTMFKAVGYFTGRYLSFASDSSIFASITCMHDMYTLSHSSRGSVEGLATKNNTDTFYTYYEITSTVGEAVDYRDKMILMLVSCGYYMDKDKALVFNENILSLETLWMMRSSDRSLEDVGARGEGEGVYTKLVNSYKWEHGAQPTNDQLLLYGWRIINKNLKYFASHKYIVKCNCDKDDMDSLINVLSIIAYHYTVKSRSQTKCTFKR